MHILDPYELAADWLQPSSKDDIGFISLQATAAKISQQVVLFSEIKKIRFCFPEPEIKNLMFYWVT